MLEAICVGDNFKMLVTVLAKSLIDERCSGSMGSISMADSELKHHILLCKMQF